METHKTVKLPIRFKLYLLGLILSIVTAGSVIYYYKFISPATKREEMWVILVLLTLVFIFLYFAFRQSLLTSETIRALEEDAG